MDNKSDGKSDGKINDGKINDGKINDSKIIDGKINDGKIKESKKRKINPLSGIQTNEKIIIKPFDFKLNLFSGKDFKKELFEKKDNLRKTASTFRGGKKNNKSRKKPKSHKK
jgi:hypothetical protein